VQGPFETKLPLGQSVAAMDQVEINKATAAKNFFMLTPVLQFEFKLPNHHGHLFAVRLSPKRVNPKILSTSVAFS
jgi:hypothetical protein